MLKQSNFIKQFNAYILSIIIFNKFQIAKCINLIDIYA